MRLTLPPPDLAGPEGDAIASRLASAAPDALFGVAGNGRIEWANAAAAGLFGLPLDRLVGKTVDVLLDPPPRLTRRSGLQQARCCRAGRQDVIVELTVASVPGGRSPELRVLVVRDVTARLFAESRVREAAKMNAVETVVRAVANDFNNALAQMLGGLNLACRALPLSPETAVQQLQELQVIGRHTAGLVRRLVACIAPPEPARFLVSPSLLVKQAVDATRRRALDTIELETRLGHGDWQVSADSMQIGDVLAGLVANADDAMPQGGVISLQTTQAHGASGGKSEGGMDYVRLDVSDTGEGIPEAVLPRIFDPFFTTRAAEGHAGLGLAMVYRTLQAHGGGVTVESRLGEGTTVSLYLRRAVPASASEGPPAGARPRLVLIADDEPVIRRQARIVLEAVGWEVIEAADGPESLAVHQREATRLGVVLLDINMPGVSGWEVFLELRRRDTTLPVVISSGLAIPPDSVIANVREPDAYLHKPYQFADLVKIMEGLAGTA